MITPESEFEPGEGKPTVCPLCGCLIPKGHSECIRCGMPLPKIEKKEVVKKKKKEPPKEEWREFPALRKCYSYLIKESDEKKVYGLFSKCISEGMKGLCVTRVYPSMIRRRYLSKDGPIIWLSTTGKEDSIRPRDLEKLSLVMEKFVSEGERVLLLDGIDYLVTNNGFKAVLRLVQIIRDQVSMSKSIMILPVHAEILEPAQLSILEGEMDEVIEKI